jgi:drug/metabolite transporter (DMT)-like permease
MTDVSARGWALIALMALTSGMLAHGALAWAQRRVPVSTISMMQLGQPGISTLWAFLLLGESVRPVQLVGMVVVVVAVGLIAIRAARSAVAGPATPGASAAHDGP